MKAAFNLAKSCTEEITWKRGYPPGQDAPGQYSAVSRKLQGLALSVSTFHTAFLLCDLVLKGGKDGDMCSQFYPRNTKGQSQNWPGYKKKSKVVSDI